MKLLTTIAVASLALTTSAAIFYGSGSTKQSFSASPSETYHVQKLVAADGHSDDHFGASLVLDGETILIGSPLRKVAGLNRGSAYLFTIDGSRRQQPLKLAVDDYGATGEFGAAVAVSGQVAIVGQPDDDGSGVQSGAAYVFEDDGKGNWNRVAKVQASPPTVQETFGVSVAIDGDYALVGALDTHGSGAVYVFERASSRAWRQVARLSADADTAENYFGRSLAIIGNRAAVGTVWDRGGGHEGGAVYVFQRDAAGNWGRTAKLTPLRAAVNAFFGHSIAASGNAIVVGAPIAGAAYLFQEKSPGNWIRAATLTLRGTAQISGFGSAIGMSGATIAVGAPLENDYAGAVYLFRRRRSGTWEQVERLTQATALPCARFGSSLAINGDTLLIGAPYDNGATINSGAAYLYRVRNIQYHNCRQLTQTYCRRVAPARPVGTTR